MLLFIFPPFTPDMVNIKKDQETCPEQRYEMTARCTRLVQQTSDE